MTARPLALALAAFALTLAPCTGAYAFCRTHDCNPADPSQNCQKDAAGCIVSGQPLAWPSLCVTFSVQTDGSAKYGITAADFEPMVQLALARWIAVLCPGSDAGLGPSLQIAAAPVASCSTVEYNDAGGNANVWMFRDTDWPYVGAEDALGLTTVHYSLDAPIILDADVEINASNVPLSVGDTVHGADLDSILTHEAGHFLGLSHTLVPGATMLGGYTLNDDSVRTLEPDDIDGICAAYPTGRPIDSIECAPRHGFAPECGGTSVQAPESPRYHGCALAGSRAPLGAAGALSVLGALLGLCRRSRRQISGR